VWEFDADRKIGAGDVLSADGNTTPPFAGETRVAPRLNPGDQLRVFVAHPGPGTLRQVVNSTFYVGKDGLSARNWLHPDDTETKSPCI
jgi:hypothetical protein